MVFGFALLAVLALWATPAKSRADSKYCNQDGCTSSFTSNFYQPVSTGSAYEIPTANPEPIIKLINPSGSNIGVGVKTVTIIGEGFVPSSVARVNGSNRKTTFIDNSHLLMQITGNDTYLFQSNGGFYITVFNPAPGGGYSNAVFFTIKDTGESVAETANNTSTNFTDTAGSGSVNDTNESNLAGNAIFGANGLFHSGLIQWIFAAILVLVAVILARRIYGADKKYQATPLKHD